LVQNAERRNGNDCVAANHSRIRRSDGIVDANDLCRSSQQNGGLAAD
jgi:hypothetical protein